jgi:hypothetical protein
MLEAISIHATSPVFNNVTVPNWTHARNLAAIATGRAVMPAVAVLGETRQNAVTASAQFSSNLLAHWLSVAR